eukprot:3848604-Prymnesium_polylepis.1
MRAMMAEAAISQPEMVAAYAAAMERQNTAISDDLADGVGRLLGAVIEYSIIRYPSKPIDAPWMASVVAAGAAMKLKELMVPFRKPSCETAEFQANTYAWKALDFFTTVASTGTGASGSTSSRPASATKVRVPKADDARGLRGFSGKAKAQAECATCRQQQPLTWCSACGLVGYCSKECQRAGWKAHKPYCRLFTDRECFVRHVMAVQTEPFAAGPWRGRMPTEVMEHLGGDVP